MTTPPQAVSVRRTRSSAPNEILKATELLLIDGGIDALSIRRVSEASGYSAPTIYHHFGDKGGLIEALLEARFSVMYEVMAAIPRREDPAAYLRELAAAFARFAIQNPDHYRVLLTPRNDEQNVPSVDAMRDLVRNALEALAEEGTLAAPSVEAAFQVMWVMLHGLMSIRLVHTDYAFVDDLTELTFDTIEAGLLRRSRPLESKDES
jgi:AcrR family transcriptional regulator